MPSYSDIRKSNPDLRGMEIFEITPIILGGDPTVLENKTFLTREKHIEAVRYWNGVIADLTERQQEAEG